MDQQPKDSHMPILIVDDDPEHLYMLKTVFGDWGFAVKLAHSGREAAEAAAAQRFALVLMDVRMQDIDGLSALEMIKKSGLNQATPVLIMTAYSKVEDAVAALKLGAYDYLIKPLELDGLRAAVDRAIEHRSLKEEKTKGLWGPGAADQLIGRSPAFQAVLELVELSAPTEATVLISGESGVGKEVVAKAIQKRSLRANKPFITINCAALAENLLEAELFGHEKGAFTGAEKKREGRVKAADNGTLFLDEIGEMAPALQAKLLRLLQEGEIQPVGSDDTERVDVRFLAATNRDLKTEVDEGRFREDLYWRLNVVNIKVPPLRERGDDVMELANFFIQRYALKNHKQVKGFTKGAVEAICAYHWPGNIRELQNALERAVILMRGEFVTEKDLPMTLAPAQTTAADLPLNLEDLERIAVEKALNYTNGNKSQAAQTLGVTRKTLAAKLKKYGLE